MGKGCDFTIQTDELIFFNKQMPDDFVGTCLLVLVGGELSGSLHAN